MILRWRTQAGNAVIPGSENEAHIAENTDIFDFTLTDSEMEEISALDKNTRYYTATEEVLQGYLAFVPDFEKNNDGKENRVSAMKNYMTDTRFLVFMLLCGSGC